MQIASIPTNAKAYAGLLLVQTAGAAALLWIVFPIFREVLIHFGEQQTITGSTQAALLGCTLVMQACYWARLRWVAVHAPFHNIFIAHLISFVARLSFLFGGALFSAIFFRHLPELGVLPPVGQSMIKAISIGAILFGLFCYSLELERFGRALEELEPLK